MDAGAASLETVPNVMLEKLYTTDSQYVLGVISAAFPASDVVASAWIGGAVRR